MIETSIESFLRTGAFGPLRLGDSTKLAISHFGEPDGISVAKKGPRILRFGRLQIQLAADTVEFISVSCDQGSNLHHPGIAFVGWMPDPGMSLDSFKATLVEWSLGFEVDPRLALPFQTTLSILSSGVRVAFADGILDKIYVATAPGNSTPALRPMSLH